MISAKSINYYAFAFLVLPLLFGCAVIPEYPSQLPPLTEADKKLEVCPDVEGYFMDEGDVYSIDGRLIGLISLSELLHEEYPTSSPTTFEIIGPEDDVIWINSFRDGIRVDTWSQKRLTGYSDFEVASSYLCEKGFVRLGRRYSVGASEISLGVTSEFIWLRKATDGSLIALHRSGGGHAVYFVLPVPTEKGFVLWYRFPPADHNHQQP